MVWEKAISSSRQFPSVLAGVAVMRRDTYGKPYEGRSAQEWLFWISGG